MRIVVNLKPEEIPKHWYNVLADLPFKLDPPLDPETKQPISPEKLSVIFPMSLIEQEVSEERFIEIPEPVLKEYAVYRPTPLIRATFLEEYLQTPARIYYKYEGVSPTGSHKPNTAIAQAYYNKIEGVKRLVTETGAGQWGSALSYAGAKFGLEVKVFMVKVSYQQKPMRKYMMNLFGGKVTPSPSEETNFGRKILSEDPDNPGSLGIAISEALEVAVSDPNTKYSLGSVLNHVLLHQTVIGLEIKKQLELIGEKPDILLGCHGGGSNFGGTILPFVPDKLSGRDIRFVACEPAACPSLTKGNYDYDFGDTAGLTPLLKMYTLGKDFIPPKIHAGGLRYHGSAPIIARLVKEGLVEAQAFDQDETFEAAKIFAKLEGIIPAPESAHAIAGAIREAKKAKEEGKERVIVFTLSGHGLLDLTAYV
ncbi:tryptophan synthase subunit beta [Thermotoga maritima MSB8]|uniref:Tryptophan synthase beta chain 2 n=1 Tax=Thermotoga maritima (strain ATCC 43589 / DSM 3109 / JCM 10099 / NBRC 100826 / MSB8) TaxID=243274 RepID=TRPB2_THEMA|nr:TrpB-like pyridoxal phosphate-dependent enzyme [Thermotoga maritima]Q9WZ09.1 RecName: Full=Tryptophan synthase beta chain 2 [Thermotoga maritima MSB8]AAD35624.1 tryptophan synthase, beta subunit [Thermotoga maritima MSB8]AGL49461.1 Tryptophan synthase beta chain like protein [Thermotoga maritima MSB8]AHD17705.1 tryptophan synthase subunit beta [Thermotoga maritima MSB8]AKE26461.1 tryptophan synthase subunit beta [Thermotoga maritima]AKE28326.1 tryptophan synthase subunit beta [Thermotoga m